jgi:sensor histidine kinase YesM
MARSTSRSATMALGVGLRNTRERLRRLYGDDQAFGIAAIEGSGVRVDLRLPYREGGVQ